MSYQEHKQLQEISHSIQGAIACAKEHVIDLKQQLKDANQRIAYLESELLLHKEKAFGLISRDQFNKFYQASRGRAAFDKEWEVFTKSFTFSTDDLSKKVMDWIEVIGPLINLGVFYEEEDPGAPLQENIKMQN